MDIGREIALFARCPPCCEALQVLAGCRVFEPGNGLVEAGIIKYPIIVRDIENGTVTPDKSYAAIGETVSLTVTPDYHFYLGEIEVEAWDSRGWQYRLTPTQVNDGTYTFVIPEKVYGPGSTEPDEEPNADTKFYVSAIFVYDESWEVAHPIIIAPTENGSASSDKAEAYIDETVTLTAVPVDGFVCKDVTIVARYKDDEDNYVEQGRVTPTVVEETGGENTLTFVIPYQLENGTKLDFGAEFSVTVTFEPNTVTGIEEINVGDKAKKGLRYNLLGLPVDENYRDIVIQDGKKHIAR